MAALLVAPQPRECSCETSSSSFPTPLPLSLPAPPCRKRWVSCFCNFRQPVGSFHLLNWSRLPVLKLASCFLESRLFSSRLVLLRCASAKRFGTQCHREEATTRLSAAALGKLDNSLLLLLKNQKSYKRCENPLAIKVNLISLFCRRAPARLQMADGTPPTPSPQTPPPSSRSGTHRQGLRGPSVTVRMDTATARISRPACFFVRSDILAWCLSRIHLYS